MPGSAFDRGESDAEGSASRRSSLPAAPVDYVAVHDLAIDGYAALELTVPVETSRYLVIRVLIVVAGEELILADKIFAASIRPVVSKGGVDDRFCTSHK